MESLIRLTPRYGVKQRFGIIKHVALFLKRFFMTTNKFVDLLEKSNVLRGVEGCFSFDVKTNMAEAKNKSGAVLLQFPQSMNVAINADVNGVLKALGYQLSDSVKWNIID